MKRVAAGAHISRRLGLFQAAKRREDRAVELRFGLQFPPLLRTLGTLFTAAWTGTRSPPDAVGGTTERSRLTRQTDRRTNKQTE